MHGLESCQFQFEIPIWKQTCTLFFNLGQVSWAMHGILSFAMHGPGRCWVTHFSTWPILRTTAVYSKLGSNFESATFSPLFVFLKEKRKVLWYMVFSVSVLESPLTALWTTPYFSSLLYKNNKTWIFLKNGKSVARECCCARIYGCVEDNSRFQGRTYKSKNKPGHILISHLVLIPFWLL